MATNGDRPHDSDAPTPREHSAADVAQLRAETAERYHEALHQIRELREDHKRLETKADTTIADQRQTLQKLTLLEHLLIARFDAVEETLSAQRGEVLQRIARNEGVQQAMAEAQDRINTKLLRATRENRGAINENPAMPDLDDITKVGPLPKPSDATKLAALVEQGLDARELAVYRKRTERILKVVLGVLIAVVAALILSLLKR